MFGGRNVYSDYHEMLHRQAAVAMDAEVQVGHAPKEDGAVGGLANPPTGITEFRMPERSLGRRSVGWKFSAATTRWRDVMLILQKPAAAGVPSGGPNQI